VQAFFGGFIGYLGTSQQIFMQQFGKTGQEFSAYFAVLAGNGALLHLPILKLS
jgi:hypothetical protein